MPKANNTTFAWIVQKLILEHKVDRLSTYKVKNCMTLAPYIRRIRQAGVRIETVLDKENGNCLYRIYPKDVNLLKEMYNRIYERPNSFGKELLENIRLKN